MLAEGLNAKIQNSSALALAASFVMQEATTCTRSGVLTLWQRRNVLTPDNYIKSCSQDQGSSKGILGLCSRCSSLLMFCAFRF
jgi:hypothetical protein